MDAIRTPSFWATLGLLCMLPLTTAALHRLGLQRCHRWMLRHSRPPMPTGTTTQTTAESVTRWVTTVNRRYAPYAAPCLAESLVLVWLLRRRGIPATVRLGVRTLFGPLESHAWASLDGHPLNDRPEVCRIYKGLNWESPPGEKRPG